MKGLSVAILLWLAGVQCLPMSEYDPESLKPVISVIEKRERALEPVISVIEKRERALEPVISVIEKRERALEPLYVYEKEPEEEIVFVPEDYGQPEDIGYGYQKSALSSELANFKEHYPYLTNQELEKLMLDYSEKGRPKDNYYIYGKTKKSVFRERDESEYPEKLQKLSPEDEDEERSYKEENIYKNQSPFRERFREVESKSNDKHINNADLEYLSALNTLWEQYQHKQDYNYEDNPESYDVESDENVQLSDEDIAAILSYFEDKNDEDQRQLEDSYENPLVFLKNDKNSKHHAKPPQKRIWRDGAYESYPGYSNSERILIKKRALKTIPDLRKKKQPPQENKQRDRDNNKNADQELTQIFGDGKKKNSTKPKSPTDEKTDKAAPTSAATSASHTHAPVSTEKPIVVRKKSINWSDYFGIDKRKTKSAKRSNDIWPAKQYRYKKELNTLEAKNMDTKFRDMEDLILDQLIKYTGAHEGVRSPEQLHSIKQKVMAQLAAAYSLEKMRHTLSDYKSAVDNHNVERNRYPDKRIAIKKEMVQPKDTGVTLEDESHTPDSSRFPSHSKKSFFRRNSNSPYVHGYVPQLININVSSFGRILPREIKPLRKNNGHAWYPILDIGNFAV